MTTLDFTEFQTAISKQFETLSRRNLYRTNVGKDQLWQTYLESFPQGTNPIFRQRTEHDCSCCRYFVKTLGNLVTITNDELVSLWDLTLTQPPYQAVANALAKLVKSARITDVFLTSESKIGTKVNYEKIRDTILTWDHFFVEIPRRNDRPLLRDEATIATELSHARAGHGVLGRSLNEITLEALYTVQDLINQNALYRGEENKFALEKFLETKLGFAANHQSDLFLWEALISLPQSVSHIRHTAIGTLLIDLSDGMDLEAAVRSFEAKVAPLNYKRPTALVTQSMITSAKDKIEELGLTSALERRYATLTDLNINDLIFADRSIKKSLKSDPFADLPMKPKPIKNLESLEVLPIDEFISTVVPKITSIELLFDGTLTNNLVSLIAPIDPKAQLLFKWNNPFSWSYAGDATDSIKQRVKKAGGNVTGDLCCRLAWYNYDDLDLHMAEPNGYNIYYGNRGRISPHGGQLDVDMNAGIGTTREPVENIFYPTRSRMRPGVYHLYAHQFSKRETLNPGFDAEIDYMGNLHNFSYSRALTQNAVVHIAKLMYSPRNGIEFLESLPISHRSSSIWNLTTHNWHRVNALLLSPNFWRDQEIGNKHYFFMLDNCQNEGQARGFYNEFLKDSLTPHRKVLEILGNKLKTDTAPNQLSGLGFSSTQRAEVTLRVGGSLTRTLRVTF